MTMQELTEEATSTKKVVRPYKQIKAMILNQQLKPGEVLTEAKLSTLLGVSRTPIREALLKLEAQRLITIEKNKGARVSELSLNDLYEAYKIRLALEKVVIEEAIARASFEDILLLENNLDLQKTNSQNEDFNAFIKLDEKFHKILVKMSGLKQVWSIIDSLRSSLARIRHLSDHSAAHTSKLIAQHEQIFLGIKNKDAVKATRSLEIHLNELLINIRKYAKNS